MTWDYRIILHPATEEHSERWYALHEVFYERGKPTSWTSDPITFACGEDEDQRGIWNSLAMALNALCRPLLIEADGKLVEVQD